MSIDSKTHQIIAGTGIHGEATYLIDTPLKSMCNADRRAALAWAHGQLHKLADLIRPLKDESERLELATQALGMLFDWFAIENGRLTGVPPLGDNHDD